MNRGDELAAQLDNLEKLNKLLKAESLDYEQKTDALRAQNDELTSQQRNTWKRKTPSSGCQKRKKESWAKPFVKAQS